jgi:sterol desaturase/sphingolipid hydroxylase (fatty acid hydroxylase superfamily)
VQFLKALLLMAAVFIPLERVFAIRPEQKMLRRDWLNDLVYLIANGQIVGLALAALIGGMAIAGEHLVPASVRSAVVAQPYWLQFGEALVLSDLGFYFAHRAFHAVPWLWRFHRIHHSIEELDWLAGARVHPIDQIITKGVSLAPLFLFGFSDWVIGAYMLLYFWQSFLVHSNVRIDLGPLRWVLASPQFHRWHHSKDREARDRNFSAQLPFLDALFGTAYMPPGVQPTAYGIDEPMRQNYLLQLADPFRSAAVTAGPAIAVECDAGEPALAPANAFLTDAPG